MKAGLPAFKDTLDAPPTPYNALNAPPSNGAGPPGKPRAGRAGGLALPRTPRSGATRGPVTRRGGVPPPRVPRRPMTPGPRGRRWRSPLRREGGYRLYRGKRSGPEGSSLTPDARRSRGHRGEAPAWGRPRAAVHPHAGGRAGAHWRARLPPGGDWRVTV